MVHGLHRRLDEWGVWQTEVDSHLAACDQLHVNSERRIALLEQNVSNAKVSNDRMYSEFKDSFSRVEKAQETATRVFADHDQKDQKSQADTVKWLRTTVVTVVMGMGGMILTLLVYLIL